MTYIREEEEKKEQHQSRDYNHNNKRLNRKNRIIHLRQSKEMYRNGNQKE